MEKSDEVYASDSAINKRTTSSNEDCGVEHELIVLMARGGVPSSGTFTGIFRGPVRVLYCLITPVSNPYLTSRSQSRSMDCITSPCKCTQGYSDHQICNIITYLVHPQWTLRLCRNCTQKLRVRVVHHATRIRIASAVKHE